ncbi:centromere protein J-like [Sciurus carolinensis]|uniref:centromere protein J-like n=1 Tax=Sciurus carolinensis TaxID=30640 RepID=UPI001FB2DA52|nr:centromere protein J-like [Sciurus carolinensis]
MEERPSGTVQELAFPAELPRQPQQRLQQQISTFRGTLRSHAARCSAAHSELQRQVDALTKQNLELREELRASELQLLGTPRRPTAPLPESPEPQARDLPEKPAPFGEAAHPSDARTGEEEVGEERLPEGKVEQTLSDGRKIISFPNGTRKEISADGKTTVIRFFNGDVKRVKPDQTVVYYYAEARTTHTTYPGGIEVVQFPNKQTEKFHPDGSKETVFPDGTVMQLKGGREETVFPDGTVVIVKRNGDKTILFSNGQKEIHTAQFKRREFPDGTIKTVYCNGCQETKYASGRLKVKDETGSIILDQKGSIPQTRP